MAPDDLRVAITDRLDQLSEARAQQRKADDEVKRLKVELATLSAKLVAAEGKASARDFAELVNRGADAW